MPLLVFLAKSFYCLSSYAFKYIDIKSIEKFKKTIFTLIKNTLSYMSFYRFELFPQKLNTQQRLIVSNNTPFYDRLSSANKKYFEHRIVRFIEKHSFIGREGVEITEEMKLLISATAIKLTFGYRKYLFSMVDRIIIYPKDYFSVIGNQQHKGETNPKYKTVVFSWKDFKEGIKIENDNLNLGLHEFTHAMHFSFLSEGSSSARYFKRNYQSLLDLLKDVKVQKALINTGYLRQYAFENKYEFLAVLVEHFFETPEEFQTKLPEIYRQMQQVLNLDSNRLFNK